VRLARILRDYAETGSLNELLAVWGFVDDTGTFLTKAGHVGVAYELKGVDGENLTHAERHTLIHHVEAALRLLDDIVASTNTSSNGRPLRLQVPNALIPLPRRPWTDG
jgi:hypothetical protein